MSTSTAQHALLSVLERELHCTRQLLETLAAERMALAQRDIGALETTTSNKIDYFQSLEALDAERSGILTRMGFETNRAGMERCFNSLPETDQLSSLWAEILSNIAECKTSNLVNGGILESGRQQVNQALGILRGQGGTSGLYTPAGSTSANLGQRKLGEV